MNLFQSPEWEEFKLKTGWQKSYRVDGILVLQKKLPLGMTMLYSPMVDRSEKLKVKSEKYVRDIKKIAEENNSVFYRLEIDDCIEKANSYQLTSQREIPLWGTANSFVKAPRGVQPDQTRVIDLTKSENEILSQMKQKGRYNIKIAQKHGVKAEETNDVNRFYNLYQNMSQRHGIGFRSFDYFQNLIDILSPKQYIKVFAATLDGKDLAVAIISYFDDTATYMFGGSSDEMKNAMAPYLLHWEIIKDAKARGCKKYDLFGVSPKDKPDHHWSGVTAFKEKLGGEYVELMGSWDLIFKPIKYKIFKTIERARGK
jgi:peptidoglycan pentaglycine glycine transferase (the first glycine)